MSVVRSQTVSTNNQLPVYHQLYSTGIGLGTDYLGNLGSQVFGNDTNLGRTMGTIFSQGLSSAGNTISNNLLKGVTFSQGLGQDVGASVAGAAAGIAGDYIGRGINSLGGDSMLSRGIGQGVATGIGTVGGATLSGLISGTAGKINPYALGAQMIGTGLQAAFGPSKEYGGRHGNITKTMDMTYDLVQNAAGMFGPVGSLVSGGMALNKGLSNIFGSTDGMTKTDAILGSAWMGAPVKWLNMAGAKTTGSFRDQSWQNTQKANSFMGNAFGNLNDKFDTAREEAGKTYGTFSRGAYNEAQRNLDFANRAWGQIMNMADQNEYQNIRSQYMSSVNNQKYAQIIQGGWNPIYRGKQGMKIFNNATNHNMGQRLLSAAALIDNKAMILCSAID